MSSAENLPAQIARQFRELYHGRNWTWVDLKETLSDVSWQEAIKEIPHFNTIAKLVYHIHYYVDVQIRVMEGKPLDGHDKDSFNAPPITGESDWKKLLDTFWTTADIWAESVESMPASKLYEPFDSGKYGNWYRNLCGVIEHGHYHLGQLVLLKKMLRQ
jgi:uncharacterized damage-inducible protein DinB